MNVVVACEFSGVVRDAFIARGHSAISVDLLPSDTDGPHYTGPIESFFNQNDPSEFDLMIAHPPCTHLAVSGAQWFYRKQQEQAVALQFVRYLLELPIPRIALENPVSVISTYIRKPDQIVQPWWFGDPFEKTTCLWLKGLPLLEKTDPVTPEPRHYTSSGRSLPAWYNLPPSPERAKLRSVTFQGFADAMAEQWGTWIEYENAGFPVVVPVVS